LPPLLILTLEVATLVCATLLAIRVIASRPRLPTAQLMALIAIGVACGVILGHQEYGAWVPPAFRIDVGGWAPFLNLARNLTPGLFMMLSFTLFTDGRRYPRALLVLLAVQMLLEEPGRAVISPGWAYARLATQTAPALLQTLFAGFALYWTPADWRGDLIESRRRTRLVTFIVGGLLTLVSGLLTRVVIAPDSPANYAAHVGVTVADLVILAFVLFQLTDGDIGRRLAFEPSAGPRPRAGADPGPALARLRALLEDERIWEEEGLTLKGLAARVTLSGIPPPRAHSRRARLPQLRHPPPPLPGARGLPPAQRPEPEAHPDPHHRPLRGLCLGEHLQPGLSRGDGRDALGVAGGGAGRLCGAWKRSAIISAILPPTHAPRFLFYLINEFFIISGLHQEDRQWIPSSKHPQDLSRCGWEMSQRPPSTMCWRSWCSKPDDWTTPCEGPCRPKPPVSSGS
jgi:hypothetical protein